MNKKHLIMVLIAFLIVPSLAPQGCAQDETSGSIFDEIRLLTFETETKITFDEKTVPTGLLNPGNEINIKATVEFKFNLPALFPKFLVGTKIGNWIMFRDTKFDEPVNISLSAVEPPSWCVITISEKEVMIENIGTGFKKSKEFSINIAVNKEASAFERGDIKIQAEFKSKAGWGLIGSSGMDNFTIETNYVGKLNASFDANEIIFNGGETKTIPLKIFNEYNDETIVEIQPSKKILENGVWNISLEKKSIIIGAGKNQTINVNITVKKLDSYKDTGDSYFDDILVLTPKSTKNPTVGIGEQFTVKSPKLIVEEEKSIMDTILMIIIAIVIIIVIAVVIILVLRRLRR